jgi:vitamin B12 transporter
MKSFSKGMLMSAIILGCVTIGGNTVFAENSTEEFTLDPMVITATRSEKRDVDVPVSTTILSTQDLKNTGAQNLQVALGRVPGLIYKTFAPGGGAMGTMANEIAIRGVSNGTLVMLNGTPMNLRGKYFLDAIPVESVERVEIVKGGGSVLYGSEAMGGVINIITKKEFSNSVSVGYGNYGQQKYSATVGAGDLNIGYTLEKWGDVDTISRSHDKGDKHTDMTGSEKRNLFLNYKLNDNLNFLYNYYETNVRYDTWFDDAYKDVPKGGAFQQNREYVSKQNLVQLNYNDGSIKGNLYYNQNKLMADGFTNYTTKGEHSGTVYDTDEKNRTYGADLQKEWKLNSKAQLILGGSYQNEFYDDYGTKLTDRHIYSVYGQYDHKFDEKNEFIFGARETWTTAGYRDQNYDNFSMSGQYLYKLTENDSIYASVQQSFIMPTFTQMYGGSEQAISNPDLKPQKGTNYEIGYKKVTDTHSWKAAIYHIDITDNITSTWNPDKSEYQYTNEDFKNTGVELSCDITGSNGFSYNWGVNYMDPKVKGTKKPYWDRKYGRWQLNGGITYTKDKWTSSLQGIYLAKRVETPSSSHSFKEKPYFLTSLTTTYNADKQNSFTLTIDNILDREDNLSHSGSEYYSTPFNFMLTYNYKF